ncbi:MAG TPA: efflux RND transporter periplasmic adaptor subunit [Chitinophagaceae bacterium]
MKKKTIWWIIGALILVIVLLIAFGGGKKEGIKVTVEAATSRTITETVNGSGKVYPEIEVKVSPDISGEVVELTVEEGDTVKKGQVLARIYADIYASQRDQAMAGVSQMQAQVANSRAQLGALKATLDQAQTNYNRQKDLLAQKVISRVEFEQAEQAYLSARANYNAALQGIRANEASVRSAMASLNRASKDVSRATITAPMTGVISLLNVKPGERVVGTAQMAGTEMMRIADLNSIEVRVDVGESDIPKVKIGDSALVEIDAFSNRKFKGIVYKIANPAASVATTTTNEVTNYKVHIRLLYDSYADLLRTGNGFPFRPNMNASADIQTRTVSNVLAVPINAVTVREKKSEKAPAKKAADSKEEDEDREADNGPGGGTASKDDETVEVVFVLQKDGTVKRYNVQTGIQDLNYIQVISGIKKGDKVVTGPYNIVSKTLKDGTRVKETKKEDLVEDKK